MERLRMVIGSVRDKTRAECEQRCAEAAQLLAQKHVAAAGKGLATIQAVMADILTEDDLPKVKELRDQLQALSDALVIATPRR